MAKVHGTGAWCRLRLQCYRRDKARDAKCWICHDPIDYDAKPSSHDFAYEPDHYHSAEDYPELALCPENIYPAHRKCNRARGKKAGVDNIGQRTREW